MIWIAIGLFMCGVELLAVGWVISTREVGSFSFSDEPFYWTVGLGLIGSGVVVGFAYG
jgi:hypothetical protein